jgi:hypothetical protein
MLNAEVPVVMPDQFLSTVAAAVAGKAAELAVQGGKEGCAALVRLIRAHLGRDKDASAALAAAREDPRDDGAVAGLATALERLTSQDAAFAVRLRELWPRAEAELSASHGGVANSATGSVGGHLMQARDVRVEGGLRFGDVDRPGGS